MDGVSDVQTDVEAKTVVVTADASVSPELMLEKLEKVRGRLCWIIQRERLDLRGPSGGGGSNYCAVYLMSFPSMFVSFHYKMQWSKASGKSVALAS